MMTPGILLLLTLSTALTFVLFLWPNSGYFWKWRRGLASTRRVLVEDALKHLHDQEYNGLLCTLQSLAGFLSITGDEAAQLMTRLEVLGLVRTLHVGFELTAEGRLEALRMIRIHRLWEKYLADETGVEQTEWHKRAEKLEHTVTPRQVEALAAAMGNPSYDPHGDPIPTAGGKLPPKQGRPLTDLENEQLARVVHIEDEPNAVYAQLVAAGIAPGMQIRLMEKTPQRVRLICLGEEVILAPVVAANVTVEALPTEQVMTGSFQTLSSLEIGQEGEVLGILPNCRGQQRRRLMDLGIIPGTIVSPEMSSASGDPTAYNIRGATIALRKSQADMIHIKSIKEAA